MEIKWTAVLGRIMNGLGFAAIFTIIALTVLKVNEVDASIDEVWKSMLGSMLIGAYYGAASFLFQFPSWSLLKSVLVHFILSIFVYLPIALWTGWLPFEWKIVLFGLFIFAMLYIVFCGCYAFYFWRIAKKMNDSIDKYNK